MREEKYEVALGDVNRAHVRYTRYMRTFRSLDEARARTVDLNRELDKVRFPAIEWKVRLNPYFKEAE